MVFLLSNLIWVAGVLFFGWKAFDLIFLYWLETGVMEIFIVAKMLLFGSLWKVEWEPAEKRASFAEDKRGAGTAMIFLSWFFGTPFAVMWIVVGDRVMSVREGGRSFGADSLHHLFAYLGQAVTGGLAVPFWSMVASYAFSLGYDYLYRGDIRKLTQGNTLITTCIYAPCFRVFSIILLFYAGLIVVPLVILVGQVFGRIDTAANFGWALALCLCKAWIDLAGQQAERELGRPRGSEE